LLTHYRDNNLPLPPLAYERIWFLNWLRGPERNLQARAVVQGLIEAISRARPHNWSGNQLVAAHSRDLNDPFCFRRNAHGSTRQGSCMVAGCACAGIPRTNPLQPDEQLRSRPSAAVDREDIRVLGPNFFDAGYIFYFVFLPTTILPIAIWSHSTNARMGTFRSQPAHGDQTGSAHLGQCSRRPVRSNGADRAMDWIETDLGRWILSADGRQIELETEVAERIA